MENLRSTLTLISEILLSVSIFYIFIEGYKKSIFHKKLAIASILYETIFNITYMLQREQAVETSQNTLVNHSNVYTALAIFHGSLSLIMFLGLIIFMVVAGYKYQKGINFFKTYFRSTLLFLSLWSVSVLSGILFYIVLYIK